MVTIYTQPDCSPCRTAKRQLEKAGIPFAEINIQQDEDAADYLKEQGFRGAPVLAWKGELHTIAGLRDIIQEAA